MKRYKEEKIGKEMETGSDGNRDRGRYTDR